MLLVVWDVLQAGIILYGMGVSGYLLARVLVGERWRFVAFTNNFLPWIAGVGLALAVIGLLSRYRWLLAGLQVPGVVAFIVLYGGLLLPARSNAQPHNGPQITVATYNIFALRSDPQRVVDVITSLDADVIGLEEVGPDHADMIDQALAEKYPYRVLHPLLPVHGVGLLSRYPILESEMWRPLPDSMLHLYAVIDVEGTPVAVHVAHPRTPRNAFSPMTYNTTLRDEELRILRERYLERQNGPQVMLCDCNMTDQSDAYQDMREVLHDAHRSIGRGMGFTWPDTSLPWMVLRIDYAWYSHHFTALDVRRGEDAGNSDHLPVIATLFLKEEQES